MNIHDIVHAVTMSYFMFQHLFTVPSVTMAFLSNGALYCGSLPLGVSLQVLGVFLDVLMDFILLYRQEMRNWLQTLYQRVFTKLGTELRSSISRRMRHLQEVIR